jgi:RimJ/RimL family protein N-acetyltransferase
MKQLSRDGLHRVAPLFEGMPRSIPLDGVLDGLHLGRVFVDDAEMPGSALVWTRWGYHYLGGNAENGTFVWALRPLIAQTLLPASRAMGEPDMLLTVHPSAWKDALPRIAPDHPPIEIFRRTFRLDREAFRLRHSGWQSRVPEGMSLRRIDADLASDLRRDLEVTWASLEDFLARGLGYVLLKDGVPVSMCSAAFVARGRVEIGIKTKASHRRRGFGLLTATAMVEGCLEAGLDPHWECFSDNTPSVRLAEALGFEPVADTPIYFWKGERGA